MIRNLLGFDHGQSLTLRPFVDPPLKWGSLPRHAYDDKDKEQYAGAAEDYQCAHRLCRRFSELRLASARGIDWALFLGRDVECLASSLRGLRPMQMQKPKRHLSP